MKIFLFTLLLIHCLNVFADTISSVQCRQFNSFATKNKKFLTDGLIVLKDGRPLFEWYDELHGPSVPHALWSVSKTMTGALLGIAVEENRLSLEDKLVDFYPRNRSPQYESIKIRNLFYLDSGFIWDEYYSGNVKYSPVLNMLYGSGHKDMAMYSATRPLIKNGPGYQWGYTTGTPVITMGVLKKVYSGDYELMPWRKLFDPLSMKGVFFERDHMGVFNGGSSIFATPRAMVKFGMMLLNRGKFEGHTILSEEWIRKTLQVSPGYQAPGTVIRDVTDDGVYGGSLWLNLDLKKRGRPYPYSPEDMFLAMGHFGQLIIVLPSQKMVIARTGHDEEYNSQIDEFVSRALSCFYDPNYPIGKEIPPPSYQKSSIFKVLKTLKSGLETNILQAGTAKSLCSCHFISRLSMEDCLKRSNIPGAQLITRSFIKGNKVTTQLSMSGKIIARILGVKGNGSVGANFNSAEPQFGCTLE